MDYTQNIEMNLTALALSLKMLEQTTNQFSLRQQEKGPKKPKKTNETVQVVENKPPHLSRW
jgi:hypothetical protein